MALQASLAISWNGKAPGIDIQNLDDFTKDLRNKLYKLWNRLASGCHFPSPVCRVEIPKAKRGGIRPFCIPTVSDRLGSGQLRLRTDGVQID